MGSALNPGIQTFDTLAGQLTRNPHPKVGDQYINKNNGALLVYWGPAVGWKMVWSQPWGQRRYTSLSAASDTLQNTPDTSEVTQGAGLFKLGFGYSFDGKVFSGRQYCLTFEGSVGSTVNNDIIMVSINCDTPVTVSYGASFSGLSQAFIANMVGVADSPARLSWRFAHDGNPYTGGGRFYVSAYRLSGTGNCYLGANSALYLDDLGPVNPPY